MRYKINKTPLLFRMEELRQSQSQRLLYLRHTISILLNENEFALFDTLAQGYHIYFMMLNKAFELIRLNYKDWLVIVQSAEHQYVIEIRKNDKR